MGCSGSTIALEVTETKNTMNKHGSNKATTEYSLHRRRQDNIEPKEEESKSHFRMLLNIISLRKS